MPVVQISAAAATPTYEEIVLSDSRESPFSTQRRGVLKRRLKTVLCCKGCSFWGLYSTLDSVLALYPAAPGLILGVPKNFSLEVSEFNIGTA